MEISFKKKKKEKFFNLIVVFWFFSSFFFGFKPASSLNNRTLMDVLIKSFEFPVYLIGFNEKTVDGSLFLVCYLLEVRC
jgi:hypothetical protein